ncbi:MAG: nitroreductase family protein [Proteobacteria bacterium]|nr:nitroreductase family protein [Pseudomonadota bacterium]MBU1585529.1 nitroreductase family protein [Pseudomonadota bacterium]MBU2452362.1 nitroreductase family protein [Pseudomonadota bacterium]MBU2630035.1 nitroreductase family protein [Pseudomonadota bacterium]
MTPSSFKDLVIQNRSCRRFDNAHKLDEKTLKDLVELARNCASAANMQPLKYVICREDQKNEDIFSCLGWAAYLKDWNGPVKAERPAGYIVIMGDHTVCDKFWCDHGIAAQTILLGARSLGLGGCMFGAVNIKKLKGYLNIADHLEVKLVLAIGKPVEEIRIHEVGEDGDIKYWRDENQVHHVPKRKLDDLIIGSW